MATGYTSIIEEDPNVTFRKYALRCARAFGACVMQRDESIDAPPRPREVDPYHENQKNRAEARLAELLGMNAAGERAIFDAYVAEIRKLNAHYKTDHEAKRAKYARIRAEVEAWEPPTREHDGIKKFMLQQIDSSFDGELEPYQAPERESPAAYREGLIAKARDDIKYHAAKHAEEVQRARESESWLSALVASLPPEMA